MPKIINGVEYDTHDDVLNMLGLTPTERSTIELQAQIVGELIKARNGAGITQQELEAISGVRQPVIARIERCKTDPQITTVLRLLEPLGKTLAVVDK